MSTASPPEDYIYQGVWTNYLRGGKVFGITLTVNETTASILSPALALIVSIAGSQLWRLFQFALHQTRATDQEKNFLFHQQQVTLRNTATDLNTLWRLIRLAFAWRRHRDIKVFWESLPLLIWTSFHLILIILIGLFSSWLLQASDDVLSRSPWCGQYSQNFINEAFSGSTADAILAESFAYSNYMNSRFAVAQQHLDVCATSSDGCDGLVTTSLPYTKAIAPGTCPFSGSICHPNASTIEFDTGYLSSATQLGLNAPKEDRISFRMQAKCAPLDDARYVTGWHLVNATSDLATHEVSDAHYGPGVSTSRNATFSYSKPNMECSEQAIVLPYELNPLVCFAGGSMAENTANFDPIPQLQSSEADTSLIMLMTNSLYRSPVTDPWFTAQLAVNDTNTVCRGHSLTVYTRETPLTTIGCTQQWQICNTDSPATDDASQCTPLQGVYQLADTFGDPSKLAAAYNPQQVATVNRILNTAESSTFYYLIFALAQTTGPPIKARSLITGTLGLSVPDNQWQIETEYWMQGLLAYIQQSSIDSSTGQFACDTKYINRTTPASDATGSAYRLCQNQIIHSTTYRNFNFFALLVCVILCAIVTILGLTIEDIIGYIRQQRLENIDYQGKKDMWFINSDLEMLRTITELKQKLRWSRSSFGIPFAPVGAKAVIDDLRSDDTNGGNEFGYTSRRTTTTVASSPGRRRAHGYQVHQRNKSCATCESFELIPTGSNLSLSKPSPNDQEQELNYADVVTIQKSHSERSLPLAYQDLVMPGLDPQVRPHIRPLQPNQSRSQGAYDVLHPAAARPSESIEETPSFHYSNDIPSSIGQPASRRGNSSLWPWSRQQDTPGTIC